MRLPPRPRRLPMPYVVILVVRAALGCPGAPGPGLRIPLPVGLAPERFAHAPPHVGGGPGPEVADVVPPPLEREIEPQAPDAHEVVALERAERLKPAGKNARPAKERRGARVRGQVREKSRPRTLCRRPQFSGKACRTLNGSKRWRRRAAGSW